MTLYRLPENLFSAADSVMISSVIKVSLFFSYN